MLLDDVKVESHVWSVIVCMELSETWLVEKKTQALAVIQIHYHMRAGKGAPMQLLLTSKFLAPYHCLRSFGTKSTYQLKLNKKYGHSKLLSLSQRPPYKVITSSISGSKTVDTF